MKIKVQHTPEQRRKIFKDFRKELGCTQKEIGDYLATPARTIERWETRSSPPEALIQMIIIKDELHDAIRERSMRIKELEEIINDITDENTDLALRLEELKIELERHNLLTPNEKRFMIESLTGTELEDLIEDDKKDIAELEKMIAERHVTEK